MVSARQARGSAVVGGMEQGPSESKEGWLSSVLWCGWWPVAGQVAGHFGHQGGIDDRLTTLRQKSFLLLAKRVGPVAEFGAPGEVLIGHGVFLLAVQFLNLHVEIPNRGPRGRLAD